jgi:hypothetical protein
MCLITLAPRRLDISDDSILTRLGVTYGVLRRLGYSEETVARCLESIDGVDLEEAHEWVRRDYYFTSIKSVMSQRSFS